MSRSKNDSADVAAPSRGRYIGTGNGPAFQPIDIGHADYVAVVEPDTAFWAGRREQLAELALGGPLAKAFGKKAKKFAEEMHTLRFGLKPSAVYFNPTERCNLNCTYCYIPESMRRSGPHMSRESLLDALATLLRHFRKTLPKGTLPQIIFHGAEPLLNRDAIFAGIEQYAGKFRFGIQTNATLLDQPTIEFLRHDVSIGISLDAPTASVAQRTRKNWEGQGVHAQVLEAMERLRGYPAWSVICTVTSENLRHLSGLVDFLHEREVPACLMNILRCTLPPRASVKPDDARAAKYFLGAWIAARRCIGRRAGGWWWAISPTSCWRSWLRRRGG